MSKVRPPDTTCRRPPKGTSKEDLAARQKAKVMGKFFRNQDPASHRAGRIHNHKGVV